MRGRRCLLAFVDYEAIPLLIVDTLNQHEQSDYNYEVALRLIKEKISASQVFVCAMDTEVIQQYKPLRYEAAGDVAAVSADVQDINAGDCVAVIPAFSFAD